MKTYFWHDVMGFVAFLCFLSAGMGTVTALVLLVQGCLLMAFAIFVGTLVAVLVAIVLEAIAEDGMLI